MIRSVRFRSASFDRPTNDALERLGVLRAGYGPSTVDHVGRHSGDAVTDRHRQLLAHFSAPDVARQNVGHDARVATDDLGGQRGEHLGVGDVDTARL